MSFQIKDRTELALREKKEVVCAATWIVQGKLLKFFRMFKIAKDKKPVIFFSPQDHWKVWCQGT